MNIRENAYSTNGWNLLSTFLSVEMLALLMASLIVLPLAWGNFREIKIDYAIAFAVTAPFCLLIAWSHNRYTQKKIGGYVELDGNMLHYYAAQSPSPEYSAAVEDCLWFRGFRTWATLPLEDKVFQISLGPQVILLQFPEGCVVPEHESGTTTIAEQPVIVTVGHTSKTRAEWGMALENAGVVCDTTRDRKWLSPISSGLGACWVLFCLGFCFVFSMFLAVIAKKLLTGWNFAADVTEAISFSFFLPGCIFLWIWVGLFPLLYVSLRTGIGQQKITLLQIILPCVAIFVVKIMPSIAVKAFSYALAYTISYFIQAVVTSVCYWFLVRPPKNSLDPPENNPQEQQSGTI